jgi:signal peptidase I
MHCNSIMTETLKRTKESKERESLLSSTNHAFFDIAALIFQRRYFVIFVVIAIVAFSVLFMIRYTTGSLNPFYIVESSSMAPTIRIGDVIVVQYAPTNVSSSSSSATMIPTSYSSASASFENLKVGDIILFKTPGRYLPAGGQHLIAVHRIVRIDTDNRTGKRIITARGDASLQSYKFIDYPIMKPSYLGKVIFVIPEVGRPFVPSSALPK